MSVILFGLMPAFQTTRADLVAVMNGSNGVERRRGSIRRLLRGRKSPGDSPGGDPAIADDRIEHALCAGVYQKMLSSFENRGF